MAVVMVAKSLISTQHIPKGRNIKIIIIIIIYFSPAKEHMTLLKTEFEEIPTQFRRKKKNFLHPTYFPTPWKIRSHKIKFIWHQPGQNRLAMLKGHIHKGSYAMETPKHSDLLSISKKQNKTNCRLSS
jgi:hypothetical protein